MWLNAHPADAERAILAWLAARGEPAYRAKQILPRLWQRPVRTWDEISDLPRGLRDVLCATAPLPRPVLVARQDSRDGTVKFLWELPDGAAVESVSIPEGRRRTLCISSQSGCAFACLFCATGRMGFGRHLQPWEITAQVREMVLDPAFGKPTNVVFMGMGEPLHNWASVDVALSILNDPRGFGIGARHITVSTVGVVPGLQALAARPEQFTVALSLHSAIGERRAALMPVERKWDLAQVEKALAAFPRRVTLEYVVIQGRNDGVADAEALAAFARRRGALVNLLALHPGGDPTLEPASPEAIEAFADRLRHLGANVTVRRSRGLDINAACGQLRVAVEAGRVRTD